MMLIFQHPDKEFFMRTLRRIHAHIF